MKKSIIPAGEAISELEKKAFECELAAEDQPEAAQLSEKWQSFTASGALPSDLVIGCLDFSKRLHPHL